MYGFVKPNLNFLTNVAEPDLIVPETFMLGRSRSGKTISGPGSDPEPKKIWNYLIFCQTQTVKGAENILP